MPFKPDPAGPRNDREMFHYLWREFGKVSTAIEDIEDGGGFGNANWDGGRAPLFDIPVEVFDGGGAAG